MARPSKNEKNFFVYKKASYADNSSKVPIEKEPFPNLEKLNLHINHRSRKDKLSVDKNSRLLYKKRLSSKKGKHEIGAEPLNNYKSINNIESKHLISSASPNYIELNKIVMDKINNPKTVITFERQTNAQKFSKTSRFKFSYKVKSPVMSTPRNINIACLESNNLQPEVKGVALGNPYDALAILKDGMMIHSKKPNFTNGKLVKQSKKIGLALSTIIMKSFFRQANDI